MKIDEKIEGREKMKTLGDKIAFSVCEKNVHL